MWGNNPFEFTVFVRKTPDRCPERKGTEIATAPSPLGASGKTDGSHIQYGRICYIDLRRTAANARNRFLGLDGNVAILA